MGCLILVWCLLGTSFALPMYPQQTGMHGMASMSFESMRRYGSPNGMSINGMSMRPQYGFGDRFPSWWMHSQPAAFPWMPLRPREHDNQQYEYALPVHPPPLPAQKVPLQPPQPGLQAPSLPQQPTMIPIRQDSLQPGQQPPVQQALPTLQQGEQMLVQQQVAPAEEHPQQFPVWEYTGQHDQPFFPLLQKWLQYGSMQPVEPQLEQGPMQPIQPQLHQGPMQPIQPQLHQGPIQPIQPQLHQGPVQPIQPQLHQGPIQPIQPQLHQGPVQPIQPQLHQGPMQPIQPQLNQGTLQPDHPQLEQGRMQPYHPQIHQGPTQHIQPHLHQGPMQPVDPRLLQETMQNAYPGIYYMQYSAVPVGSPARLGIVSSEEMQGGQGGGPYPFGAMYPGFVSMGQGYGGGGTLQNSVLQGDYTAEDDSPPARGKPTAQGGVVLIQNGNSPAAGASPPINGAGPPVVGASPPLPEGNPTGQGSIFPYLNSNIPNLGPDPAGQIKLPIGLNPTQVPVSTQAISDNYVPPGADDTTPIGVQKELLPNVVDVTAPTEAQTTTSGGDLAQQPENKWYFQEP